LESVNTGHLLSRNFELATPPTQAEPDLREVTAKVKRKENALLEVELLGRAIHIIPMRALNNRALRR